MSGIAWVFPGQGSQYPGMGQELCQQYPAARAVFEEADDILGYALSRMCFDGPKDALDKTECAQPAVLTCSVAAWAVLKEYGLEATVMAGLSLGEYTALVAGGALNFAEALPLIQNRARLMQNAVPIGEGAMAAIIGMPVDKVETICEQTEGPVVVANYNAPGQVVISGASPAVSRAGASISAAGGRVVPLAVSVPSHSPLMADAARSLEPLLEQISWQPLRVPVISNVTAREHEAGQIAALLARQLYSPVLWEQSVRHMLTLAGSFIEVGPGSSLSALIKRIERGAVIGHAENTESVNNLLDKLRVQS